MIDYARIIVIGGKGGDGTGSFTHIKGKRRGKADGGDGGRGSHVFLEATRDLNTLEPFRFVKEYRAQNGGNGASRRRKGAEGEDLIVKVPAGTFVKKASGPVTTFPSSRATLSSYDLIEEGQKVLVATGGAGGRGNVHLRDEFGRRPKSGEPGQKGEEVKLTLELKLIADVGLIGLPNSGKSTLLRALTSARPKIAPYPFTTLEPNLGVFQVRGYVGRWDSGKRKPTNLPTHRPKNLIIADIPGLIEGASRGKGLGDLFLRHIERTKILVHLIDIWAKGNLWQAYQTIRNELRSYSKELSKKKEVIVLNKIDLVNEKIVKNAIDEFKSHRKKVILISAKRTQNLDLLTGEIYAKLS